MKDVKKNWQGNFEALFNDLQGETLIGIGGGVGDAQMLFNTLSGKTFGLTYYPDCCADCSVEEIIGDLSDVLNSPILLAEEVNSGVPEDIVNKRKKEKEEHLAKGNEYWYSEPDSETWVFYKLSTIKGSVTIRWFGSSNGYYSERATFELME